MEALQPDAGHAASKGAPPALQGHAMPTSHTSTHHVSAGVLVRLHTRRLEALPQTPGPLDQDQRIRRTVHMKAGQRGAAGAQGRGVAGVAGQESSNDDCKAEAAALLRRGQRLLLCLLCLRLLCLLPLARWLLRLACRAALR